jgi:hypothetical protein
VRHDSIDQHQLWGRLKLESAWSQSIKKGAEVALKRKDSMSTAYVAAAFPEEGSGHAIIFSPEGVDNEGSAGAFTSSSLIL